MSCCSQGLGVIPYNGIVLDKKEYFRGFFLANMGISLKGWGTSNSGELNILDNKLGFGLEQCSKHSRQSLSSINDSSLVSIEKEKKAIYRK